MPLKLPEHLRSKLKEPLGFLIRGRPGEVEARLREVLRGFEGEIVTVGDIVSLTFINSFYPPKISIVDFRSLRRPYNITSNITVYFNFWVKVRNPPATISEELFSYIRTFFELRGCGLIIVEGEEDLATLPVILEAPSNTLVLYGQPGEGVVVVEPSPEVREKVRRFIEMFEKY